jgi:hypothetical protein
MHISECRGKDDFFDVYSVGLYLLFLVFLFAGCSLNQLVTAYIFAGCSPNQLVTAYIFAGATLAFGSLLVFSGSSMSGPRLHPGLLYFVSSPRKR